MFITTPVVVGTVARICAIVIPSALYPLRVIASGITIGMKAKNTVNNLQENNFQYFRQIIENDEINQNPLELYLNGTRRCAMSLWKYFPSGVASFFSMLFINQCVRHEYLIIYTQNYVISAEISRSKDCQTCQFQNQTLEPNLQPQKCRCKKKKYNKRAFSRVLKCFSVEKKNIAEQFSFSKLLSLWTIIFSIYQARVKNNSFNKIYHLLVRNCKTFARSSFYFLDKDFQKYKIFESIFGLYSDKPGYLFDPLQSGVICALEKGMELMINDYLQGKNMLEQIIENLRQLQRAIPHQDIVFRGNI
ncbi:hypothetical protein ABPG72_011597 [Tetrahymena utriculariae]